MSQTQDYRDIQIRRPIYIKRVTPEEMKGERVAVYLLVGPTGSGKSAVRVNYITKIPPVERLSNNPVN
ncbi:hypothetical protein BJ165DRAFT_1597074 [Panaeolus papilionaceus]|nr:hypothetical protein BJ165DRAFT_1597074 [Panaeolus papilionaceus]